MSSAPGKHVLITGAAGGIGSAATELMRERGASVIGLDLEADPSRDILACDVRDQVSVDDAVATAIERLGGLDVLINNAGIGPVQRAADRPEGTADAVIDINLMGPWRVTGAAVDALRASRGRVINIASGLAHMAIPVAPAYCMAKRGLTAYSDSLRHELHGEVDVTTVYPGYIRTPIHEAGRESGVSLEGVVPAESVEDAARTLARAALGRRPARDLATTRSGGVGYFFMRHLPRGWIDGIVGPRARKATRDVRIPSPESPLGQIAATSEAERPTPG